jgi:general stress protein 26
MGGNIMSEAALSLADLWKKIGDVKIGMFTTTDEAGQLSSRPMTTREIDDDGVLWFFVSLHSDVSRELSERPLVNVSFSEPKNGFYASLSGQATLIEDRALYAKLWRPLDKAWFSCGVDDPNLALIRFDVHIAEYWDSASSRMVQLIKVMTAAMTRGNAPANISHHGSIKL